MHTLPDDVLHWILTETLVRPGVLRLVCRRWRDLWDAHEVQLTPGGHAALVPSRDLVGRFQSVKRLDLSALPRALAHQYAEFVANLPSLSAVTISHVVGFHSSGDNLSPAVRDAHEMLMMSMETCRQSYQQGPSYACQLHPLLAALAALPALRSLTVKPTDPLQLVGTASRESCQHTMPQVRTYVSNPMDSCIGMCRSVCCLLQQLPCYAGYVLFVVDCIG